MRNSGLSALRPFLWPRARRRERRSIWIHAVSVGETSAARDLIAALADEYGETFDLLVTCVTRAGREYARGQFGDSVRVEQYPYDLPWCVGRFVRGAAPALAIMVESEIWPNMIRRLAKDGTPVLVLNGRISAKATRRFRNLPPLFGPIFRALSHVGASSRTHAARFRLLGAPHITVTGNLKFDRRPDARQVEEGSALRARLLKGRPDRRVLLCVSTRPGEEEALLRHLRPERLRHAMLAIVPRHSERAGEVAAMLRQHGFETAMKSECAQAGAPDALVGDTLGEMPLYCALADVAIVCGSFLPYGGQNPHEPMSLGKPTVVGPHCSNFSQFVLQAHRRGALVRAADASDAADLALGLLGDPARAQRVGDAARAYAHSLGGATERSLALMRKYLQPPEHNDSGKFASGGEKAYHSAKGAR